MPQPGSAIREIIEDDVWTWLSKADDLIVLGDEILQQHTAVSCYGLLPDPKARYALGRRAKKSLSDIKDHLAEVKFDEVSYRPVVEPPVEVKVRSASSSTVRYVDLRSRALVLKKIIAALGDHERIGIYGMGGVGKTTLLKEVEKKAKESGRFGDVVSAFVSQTPDVEAIKRKIVNKLRKLESSSSEDETNKKTLLVLLDDLWNKLDNIGIQDSNKVKVKCVMTSRKQELLTKQMNCLTTFPLGVLEEEEGWSFFAELVGAKVEDLKRNRTTVELLKKCAGLPVSIEALAKLWKNKRDLSSTDVLNMDELKIGKESIDGSVSLELSYNHLGDSEQEKQAKLIFRTIGLLGVPNVPILTLLKYGVGLGLFGGNTSDNIMERARREITTSVRILQDSSLLLESDDIDHVKIHDVVRDVAVSITSRDDHALIFNSDDDMKRWSKRKLRKSTAISLPIRKLNLGWKCPNMSIFIMDARAEKRGDDPIEVPNSFFKNTPKLRIIHLKNARLTSLPPSIQTDVRDLTTLCLHDCYLENVAVIGELKSLQVLSFLGSDIAQLPKEIGELTKLRMLDLSRCSKLVMIEPGVLEKLTRLEELYLKESFEQWEADGVARKSNASLAELNKLQLSILEVRILDASTLPPNFPFGNLVHYKVLIGDAWDWSGGFKEMRTLKFKVNLDNTLTAGWLQSSLEKTQDLHIDGLDRYFESFHELCRKGFKELKHLHLKNSPSIKYLIWSTDWLACSSFTILESMNLEKMNRLETIGHGLVSSTSFSKLRFIKVHNCENLKYLFSLSLAKCLADLEEIEVSNCNMIQEIVFAELMNDRNSEYHNECAKTSSDAKVGMVRRSSEIILRKLRSLVLRNLTEIITFFTKEAAPSEPTETTVPTFFNDQQGSLQRSKLLKFFPSFKFKKVQPSVHLELGNLGRLELEDCNKIVHFISSNMLLELSNLESLSIKRCDSLENIFDLEDIDAKSGTVEILPKLSELKLKGLAKLQHIWKKNVPRVKGCPKLRILEIHQCESLLYLSGSSMCEGMENLTEINIVKCDKMKTIFLEEDGLGSDASTLIRLASLKILAISKCRNLKGFLSCNLQVTSMVVKCSNQGMPHWCCGRQDSISSSFFSQKVFLPSLETLVLSDAGKFEKLWCNEVPDQSYFHLEFINVEYCHFLLNVFPASLVERLHNLKQLRIDNCKSLETVFDLAIMWKAKKKPKALMLTQLEEVRFSKLENLKHIVDMDSGIVVGFPSLKTLEVLDLRELIYLMPATTATTLLKLETLEIGRLLYLEEVINGEVCGRNRRNVITFPNLTSLSMFDLESMSCFSSNGYSLDFMGLKWLSIRDCKNLKTFVKPPRLDGEKGSSQGEEDSLCTPRQAAALFNEKVQLPNLEELYIADIRVEELWCNNEPPPDFFCSLKLLRLGQCSRLRNIIPISMIQRLRNLECMEIDECKSLEDIFNINTPTTQLDQKHTEIIRLPKLTLLRINGRLNLSNLYSGAYTFELPSLMKLRLIQTTAATALHVIQKVYLPNLEELEICQVKDITSLWPDHSEEPPPIGSLCKLKCLKVERCSGLEKILLPSFMLKNRLHNLEELVVEKCDGLETITELESKLVARSSFPFQNLTSVRVKSCACLKNLFTIISDDDGETATRIVVPRLTSLRLVDLPVFSHLLEGGHHEYILEMSSLNEVFLIRCGVDDEAISQKVVFPKEVQVVANDDSFFGSTTDVLTKTREALQSNQIIGVCGSIYSPLWMAVERMVKEEAKHFDVALNLSGRDDTKNIQESMASSLGILYSELGVERRAQRLRKSFLSLKDRRFLIILDDPSPEMDLEAVGIPHVELINHKQILISGERELLRKMGAEAVIDFGEEVFERWRIFKDELEKYSEPLLVEGWIRYDDKFRRGMTTITEIMKALHPKNDQILIAILVRLQNISHLLNSICSQVLRKEANWFDQVVRISISQQLDHDLVVTEIQKQFGSNLGINYYCSETITERAQQLRSHLLSNNHQDKKRLLVIIDTELDGAIDLEAVGILLGELDPKLFKIILASGDRQVVSKMGAPAQQAVIDVDSMYRFDMWCYRILADDEEYVVESELKKLADECGSNDVAKRLVKKLKGQGLVGWAKAFELLQHSAYTYQARRGVVDSLYSTERKKYKQLQIEEV